MVELLQEDREDFFILISELHSLREVDISDAEVVLRELKKQHVEDLSHSDPRKWPAVLITKIDIGYVLLDGYHRVAAAVRMKLKSILATCRTFHSQDDVIEVIFDENVTHGLKISAESRSEFAYWYWKKHPDMRQEDIANRCGITQSAVSHAISRREVPQVIVAPKRKKRKRELIDDPPPLLLPGAGGEQWRGLVLKSCRTLADNAQELSELLAEENLDETQQKAVLVAALGVVQGYQGLLNIAHLLEEAFKSESNVPIEE